MPQVSVQKLTDDHAKVSVAIEYLMEALQYGAKCAEAGLERRPEVANQHAQDFYNRVSRAKNVLAQCILPS